MCRLNIIIIIIKSNYEKTNSCSTTKLRLNQKVLANLCLHFLPHWHMLNTSGDANKIKTLIEYWKGITVSVICENWVQYIEWFRRNSLLKTRNFTENVWLINFLPHSNFAVDGWYFLQYCLQKAENCTNCST